MAWMLGMCGQEGVVVHKAMLVVVVLLCCSVLGSLGVVNIGE